MGIKVVGMRVVGGWDRAMSTLDVNIPTPFCDPGVHGTPRVKRIHRLNTEYCPRNYLSFCALRPTRPE